MLTAQAAVAKLARMEIVENLAAWETRFKSGWLAYYERTGEVDWGLYKGPRNMTAPAGPAIKLSESRLILISTAGGYLRGSQEPFDASNDLGDTSIRLFPSSTPLDALAYAHEHYDHDAADADPQVLLPLRHLDDLVAESVPQVLEAALASGADAALLVPA